MRLPHPKLPRGRWLRPALQRPGLIGLYRSAKAARGQPDRRPGTPSRQHGPMRHPAPPVVVPRWIQLVLLPLAILGAWALARAAGPVLLILVVAALIALMLNPAVRTLERYMPRGLAIPLTYVACFAVVGAIGVGMSNPISTQVSHFARRVPELVSNANRELDQLQRFLNRNGVQVKIEQQGQTALQTLQRNVLRSSGSVVSFSQSLLSQVVRISFELVLVLVLSVYLLVYGRDIGKLVRRLVPPGDGTPGDDYPLLIQRAVSGYVRGQLLFSLIMGTSAALCLEVLGLIGVFPDGSHYAVFLGTFYGLMEFIPYVGPIIGPAPAVLVALFDDPITAVWVVLLFVALQQLEGHFVAPQVFRISLRINPVLIILSLLLGYQLYGIAGALIALPVAAVIRQTVVYLRRHLVLEPWTVGAALRRDLAFEDGERCPDCGAPAAGTGAFCHACGASLEPRASLPRR